MELLSSCLPHGSALRTQYKGVCFVTVPRPSGFVSHDEVTSCREMERWCVHTYRPSPVTSDTICASFAQEAFGKEPVVFFVDRFGQHC